MTVVVDLGCYHHPEHQGASQDSVSRLIERYRPDTLYGFDPHPNLVPGNKFRGGVWIHLQRAAAWTCDGEIGYTERGLSSWTHEVPTNVVSCFDLARWLGHSHVILKLDVEGAEYAILEHLLDTEAIGCVDELLVEWHPVEGWEARKASILERLTCPVREWD